MWSWDVEFIGKMPAVEKIRLVIAFLYAIRSIGASIQPAEGILGAGNGLRNLVLMRFPHDVVLTPKLYKSMYMLLI